MMNKKSFNLDIATQEKLNELQKLLSEQEEGEELTESSVIRRAIRYYHKTITSRQESIDS